MAVRRLKFWGWGFEDTRLSDAEERALTESYAKRFGVDGFERLPVPRVEDIALRGPRLRVPATLEAICSTAPYDRLAHTYGKSFPDSVRAFDRDFANAPDAVASPRNEDQVVAILDWAEAANAAVIPFGGGTSVVGGTEPAVGGAFAGAISLDLKGLDRVLEIDKTSRAARFQAGILGPALEAALKPEGLTLRHFPQSFEFSTLGGWIATRSGGHFATLYTHIDDFVESLRMVTPAGVLESRRLPGSGAGPSPDRLMIGSEGALGILTEAWVRLQDRPKHRASASVSFKDIYRGAEAVRAVGQAGLYPSNLRLLDANEARNTGAGDGTDALMVLAFESADHPVEAWLERALEICADAGGGFDRDAAKAPGAHLSGAAGAWREAFIRMPYNRELLTAIAVINDTFETAITWDRFRGFHDSVKAATEAAVAEATGHPGPGHLPLHPRLSGRPGALLHLPRPGPPRCVARAVAAHQDGGRGRGDRPGRHHHPPSRRRAQPHAVVRPPTPGAVWRRTRGGQGQARPGRPAQPGRPGAGAGDTVSLRTRAGPRP